MPSKEATQSLRNQQSETSKTYYSGFRRITAMMWIPETSWSTLSESQCPWSLDKLERGHQIDLVVDGP